MAAIELVSDRDTKKAADKRTMAAVAERVYDAGVMIRVSGNNIILSPPLILEPADVARIAAGIDAGLSAAK
jgi:adenosylmethionine-8-amino-7-oxononanoate aminotransferase